MKHVCFIIYTILVFETYYINEYYSVQRPENARKQLLIMGKILLWTKQIFLPSIKYVHILETSARITFFKHDHCTYQKLGFISKLKMSYSPSTLHNLQGEIRSTLA